jgi:GT2 family glycosyltransferase
MGVSGTVSLGPSPTSYRVNYRITSSPLISIIIPNQDHAEDLQRCIDSILQRSTYPHFEIIVVENNSRISSTFRLYESLTGRAKVRIFRDDRVPFNYSLVNTSAAARAKGTLLLFLNNDTEVISPDWLQQMLGHAQDPRVGIVGARLFFPGHTIQHAGVALAAGLLPVHPHQGASRSAFGNFGRACLPQDFSAVTGACLMIKKRMFSKVGGFDPRFQLAYGDVDLCLRVRREGYLVVWTPYAELYHHESRTRGPDTGRKELRLLNEWRYLAQRWSSDLPHGDEYYNPNLGRPASGDLPVFPGLVTPVVRITPGLRTRRFDPARGWTP